VLAIIPARGGSKGIRLKNLVEINGKSLIQIVGDFVKKSEQLDYTVVSTDNSEIKKAALDVGLEVPFDRPKELAGDIVSDVDVLSHALLETEKLTGLTYEIVVMLQPTSPFRQPTHLTNVLDYLTENECDSVLTVSETDSKSHPLKQLTVTDGYVGYYDERGKRIIARQQLTPIYQRNGLVYAMTRDCLLMQRAVIGGNCSAIITSDPYVNIDTIEDVNYANYLIEKNIIRHV